MSNQANQTAIKHIITSGMNEDILLSRKELIDIIQATGLNTKQVCELQKFLSKNFIKTM